MAKNVVIVGGGIAGLAASVYLARAGFRVALFEKRRQLGGRAITHLRHGYRFNLGPHTVFRTGAAAHVYREIGVPLRGGRAPESGIALVGGERHELPISAGSLLTTSLLSTSAKLAGAALMWRLRSMDTAQFASMTAREWLDEHVADPTLRSVIEALMRMATFSDHPELQSAAAALAQLSLMTHGSVYVDEGWQRLVDGLHSNAVAAGVSFVSTSRVVAVEHDGGAVRAVELGGLELEDHNDTLSVALPEIPPEGVQGTRLPADAVVLAIDPANARELIGDPAITDAWGEMQPVSATCLDVALTSLPVPEQSFALGLDRPVYLSAHSSMAQLTPKGGALIHVARYRKQRAVISDDEFENDAPRKRNDVAAEEQELENLLDELQPGWRDVLVHRRFLPSMTVSNNLVTPSTKRPAAITPISGLYLAGDWVGGEGLLSDAALSSARAAAQAIISRA